MKKNKIIAVLLLFCTFLFSSCLTSTVPEDPNETIATYNIDNFQVVYKNQFNEQGIMLENFAVNVWDKLVETYGYSSEITENSSPLSNLGYPFNYIQAIYLIDTIRGYAFYSDNKLYFSLDGAWNWTFNTTNASSENEPLLLNVLYFGTDVANEQNLWSEIYTVYKSNTRKNYADHYDLFKSSEDIDKALKIVIYEIALNKEPTIFKTMQSGTSGEIKLTATNGKNLENYLAELQQEYRTTSSYIGLTEEKAQEFKQYILDNIIGQNAIDIQNKSSIKINETTYNNISPVFAQNKDYDEIIDIIIESEYKNKLEPCINSTLAVGTSAKKTDFLLTSKNTFSNIVARPYQSIIINPDMSGVFLGFTFAIECEKDVTMNIKITYYDLKNNTATSEVDTFNINKNTTLSDVLSIHEPKTEQLLSPLNKSFDSNIFSQSTTINNLLNGNIHKLSEYYPIINTSNNLITTSINASLLSTAFSDTGFVEISFIPSEYVNFKFGIMTFHIDNE